MSGIIGYGVYVPKYRIKQQDIGIPWGGFGMGEKAVCGWDEDIVSMAAEAVDNAMKNSGVKAADVGALYMATASSHMVEMHLSPILAELLGLSPQASVLDFTGSVNAVGTALSQCMMAIEAKRIKHGIVVGTENRMVGPGSDAEVSFGAAAVAHGSLTVTVSEDVQVSQPGPLAERGETVVTPSSTVEVAEEPASMFLIKKGVTLNDIVMGVNRVGAAPSDLVAILEALKEVGALRAELIIL